MKVNRDFLKNYTDDEKAWLEKIMPHLVWVYGDSASVKMVHIPTNVVALANMHKTVEENTEEALLQVVQNVIKWNALTTMKYTGEYTAPTGEIEKILTGGVLPFSEKPKKKCSVCERIRKFFRRNR
jgi:hypothetical protein